MLPLVISVIYLNSTPLFPALNLSFFIISTPIITEGPVESKQASTLVSALEVKSRIAFVAFSTP